MIDIQFLEPTAVKFSKSKGAPDTLVIGVYDDLKFGKTAKEIDKKSEGVLTRALEPGKFKGKKGQSVAVVTPSSVPYSRILLLGLGDGKKSTPHEFQTLGAGAIPALNAIGAKHALWAVEEVKGKSATSFAAAHMGAGATLRSYRFDKYRTTEKAEDKPTLKSISFGVVDAKAAIKEFLAEEKVIEGVVFTRDVVSEPANVIHPESLADRCKELVKLGVKVEILGEGEMYQLGMHSLLGVGLGSNKESKLVVMRWDGAPGAKDKRPVTFVGKGVCFDTGGISIKPAGGMEEMKWDMAGAGVVIGLMKTLAGRKAKVNALGVVGLVENMPDGNAQRPGDVVISMSGQTIEVINTDAEGRLVLADALWYAQTKFKPRFIVDLATLTGAIIISLGSSRAGLFSNDDKLAQQLFDAGERTGEDLWRLPLGEVYDKQINSDIADMKNVGEGREAGSITAAQFLQRFIKEGTPWAHLDIAGTAWGKKDTGITPKGATAFGVRLLNELVAEEYEG